MSNEKWRSHIGDTPRHRTLPEMILFILDIAEADADLVSELASSEGFLQDANIDLATKAIGFNPYDSMREIMTGLIDSKVEPSFEFPETTAWQKTMHGECNCVPDLGPSHCHLCGDAAGHFVPWDEAPCRKVLGL